MPSSKIGPNPLVSVITPTNDPSHLAEIFQCLAAQTHAHWEWVILPNGGARVPEFRDPRVRVVEGPAGTPGRGAHVGALKLACAKAARGEVFVELDHDDLLSADALAKVAVAASNGADFIYSDFAEFNEADMSPHVYGPEFGWRYRDVRGPGNWTYKAASAPPAEPPWILYITHAPNHVRAWTRACYFDVGGHDASLEVGDDYDLLIRTYAAGKKFHHIPECLYFYRMRADRKNTHVERNARIQEIVWQRYDQFCYAAMLRWCRDKGLLALDLGAAHSKPNDQYVGVDVIQAKGVDKIADLDKEWPFETGSVGLIRAWDAIEHYRNPVHTFNEAYRVLAPRGMFMIEVPSTDGRGAWQDPTHYSFFNQNSFWYYTRDEHKRYVAAIRAAFMPVRLITYFPSDFHRQNNIPYVRAHLVALKQGISHPMPMPHMRIPD
ncbi:MAG: glycosyltransferase [Phycisphaerae bacterium]|nr:glycosyltransferase [Phycisphaerae bacterium]